MMTTTQTRLPQRSYRRSVMTALAVLLGGVAMAANAAEPAAATKAASVPAAVPTASAPAAPQTALPEMSQAALLEHQAKHADHLFVLDVRSPEEFREGHVPGAVNVPYDQIAARIAEVPKDKDVVLYCRSGRRAGIAADVLAANGYTRLSHLEGDMTAWIAQGRPVVEGP
ncbi:MAG: rhodanese-like domain-containing protein [Steroidobacteraceae bacterium]